MHGEEQKENAGGDSVKDNFFELNEQTQFVVEDQDDHSEASKATAPRQPGQQSEGAQQIFIPQNPASSSTQSINQNNEDAKSKAPAGPGAQESEHKFHNIIDVETEISKSNFEPLVLCLKYNYVDKNYIDKTGYNSLHHVTSFKNRPLIRMLVEKFGIDVNIRSASGQTALMIAANFSFIDIVKYFIDLKCEVNLVDSCNFNALLYAVKQNHISTFIALLHKGCSLDIADGFNCSVVHWAAFKNSLWLLRFFKRLNLDLFIRDNHNFSPLHRAILNDSYECVYYLAEEQNIRGVITRDDLEKTKSKAIREFLQKRLDPEGHRTWEETFWKFWDASPKVLSFICYMIFLVLLSQHYLIYVSTPTMNDYFFLNVVFSVLLLYFYVFILWFIFRLKSPTRSDVYTDPNFKHYQNEYFKGVTLEDMKRENFQHIDKLLERAGISANNTYLNTADFDHSTLELTNSQGEERAFKLIPSEQEFTQYTFLHIIAYLFERNRFTEMMEIDYNRFCPTCLHYKPPKTKHVPQLGGCVSFYNHYSRIFNTHFNFKNHVYYLILLALQQALLSIFLLLQILLHSSSRKSFTFLVVFETGFIISEQTFSGAAFFFLCNVLLFYNTLFLFIENYGIVNNLSYSEIFNRHRYRYLFKTVLDKKGKAWKLYVNSTSQGYARNVSNYIKRAFS